MRTVWLVFYSGYEGELLLGVFSTKWSAEQFKRDYNKGEQETN